VGYRLLPEGQLFASPVQLAFRYSADDLAGTAPDVVAVAYQEAQGYWRKLMSGTYDAPNKTLTVSTTHFTDWVTLAGFQLSPGSAAVPVNATLNLSAVDCEHVAVPGNAVQTRLAKCTSGNVNVNTWAVNTLAGGDGRYGTIVGGSLSATYTAPTQVPALNPVSVSASVDAGTRSGARSTLQLVSNVLVFDDSWEGITAATTGAVGVTGTAKIDATVKWVLQSRVNNIATYLRIRSLVARFPSPPISWPSRTASCSWTSADRSRRIWDMALPFGKPLWIVRSSRVPFKWVDHSYREMPQRRCKALCL
jgi:hypothetical protein